MKNLFLFLAFNFLLTTVFAQYTEQVKQIDCNTNGTTTFTANLSNGAIIKDLSWASNSSVACFPATQNKKFSGNHVLHAFDLPPYANVEITVTPKRPIGKHEYIRLSTRNH